MPDKFEYWTDNDHDDKNWVHKDHDKLDPIYVSTGTRKIHLLGVHTYSATVGYYQLDVVHHHGDEFFATLRPNDERSRLKVIEEQTGLGLGEGTTVALLLGVHSPSKIKVHLQNHHQGEIHLDAPKGVLVTWMVYGPQNHIPSPDSFHAITPFHAERQLLKTVNIF